MAEQSTPKAKRSSDDGLFIGLIVLVVLVAFLWPQVEKRLSVRLTPDVVLKVKAVVPWVIVVLAVIAVVALYRMILNHFRRKRVTIMEGLLFELFSKRFERTYEPSTSLRVRWIPWTSKVSRVEVFYPSDSEDRDPKWRVTVADAIAHRALFENYSATWDPRTVKVVVKRRKPEPVIKQTEEEKNRDLILSRTVVTLTPLFGAEIRVAIRSWTEDPGDPAGGYPLRIDVDYPPTTRDVSVNWRRRLEQVVSLKIPPGNARWIAEYRTSADEIILKHRPPLPEQLVHPGPVLWSGFEGTVLPYAMNERGETVGWAVEGREARSHPTVHTLIIGPTGTGKTSAMRGLLTGGTGQRVWVMGVDPKRIELTPFRGWPGVAAVGSSPEDMAELIKVTYDLMESRYTRIEAGANVDRMDPIIVFLDELLILNARLNRWWSRHKNDAGVEDKWGTKTGTKHPALGMVAELLALARSAKIRLVEGVQRPDAPLFEDGSRDNLRHRVSLGRLSAQGAEMLWGDTYTGTDIPLVSGRAVASPDGGIPQEVQMYWVPDPRVEDPVQAALMRNLRSVAEEMFSGVDLPDGLDLRDVSDVARYEPEGPILNAPPAPGVVVEHSDTMMTEEVFMDQLMVGDKILSDYGDILTVESLEQIDTFGEDDEDLVRMSLTGHAGTTVGEGPSESVYRRVLDLHGDATK